MTKLQTIVMLATLGVAHALTGTFKCTNNEVVMGVSCIDGSAEVTFDVDSTIKSICKTHQLATLSHWGGATIGSGFFEGCTGLVITATDVPFVKTDVSSMFKDAKVACINIDEWDMSEVTNMRSMFSRSTFNNRIGDWNISKVTNMGGMFEDSTFNRDIGEWKVNEVTDMANMFKSSIFNRDITKWIINKVTDMENMFTLSVFNRDIGSWEPENVTNMVGMFEDSRFDGDIADWGDHLGSLATKSDMFKDSFFTCKGMAEKLTTTTNGSPVDTKALLSITNGNTPGCEDNNPPDNKYVLISTIQDEHRECVENLDGKYQLQDDIEECEESSSTLSSSIEDIQTLAKESIEEIQGELIDCTANLTKYIDFKEGYEERIAELETTLEEALLNVTKLEGQMDSMDTEKLIIAIATAVIAIGPSLIEGLEPYYIIGAVIIIGNIWFFTRRRS